MAKSTIASHILLWSIHVYIMLIKKGIKQRVKFEFEQLKFTAAATKEDGECMITINLVNMAM